MSSHKENILSFSEEAKQMLTNEISVHYWLEDTTLHIKYCRSGVGHTVLAGKSRVFTQLRYRKRRFQF